MPALWAGNPLSWGQPGSAFHLGHQSPQPCHYRLGAPLGAHFMDGKAAAARDPALTKPRQPCVRAPVRGPWASRSEPQCGRGHLQLPFLCAFFLAGVGGWGAESSGSDREGSLWGESQPTVEGACCPGEAEVPAWAIWGQGPEQTRWHLSWPPRPAWRPASLLPGVRCPPDSLCGSRPALPALPIPAPGTGRPPRKVGPVRGQAGLDDRGWGLRDRPGVAGNRPEPKWGRAAGAGTG